MSRARQVVEINDEVEVFYHVGSSMLSIAGHRRQFCGMGFQSEALRYKWC